tara:strand:+ start:71 stop:358 length:288 start_codon:yes stop_codon:yes gene_type:complete
MSDSAIFNKILSEPIRPVDFKTLEMILSEYPILDENSPMLYSLYLGMNEAYLSAEEIEEIRCVILKLKVRATAINHANVNYMEKHLDKVEETPEI